MWNSKERMTRREYIKYHTEAKDMLGKDLKPGDTVVVNNNYRRTPIIGTLKHSTEQGKYAIEYVWRKYNGKVRCCWAYREPSTVVKLKSGRSSHK